MTDFSEKFLAAAFFAAAAHAVSLSAYAAGAQEANAFSVADAVFTRAAKTRMELEKSKNAHELEMRELEKLAETLEFGIAEIESRSKSLEAECSRLESLNASRINEVSRNADAFEQARKFLDTAYEKLLKDPRVLAVLERAKLADKAAFGNCGLRGKFDIVAKAYEELLRADCVLKMDSSGALSTGEFTRAWKIGGDGDVGIFKISEEDSSIYIYPTGEKGDKAVFFKVTETSEDSAGGRK